MNMFWPKEKTELLLCTASKCLRKNGEVNWKEARAYKEFSIFDNYSNIALSKRWSFLRRKELPGFHAKERLRGRRIKWPLTRVIKTIKVMDSNLKEDTDTFRIAVILFSIIIHGIAVVRSGFTGYSEEFVKTVLDRLLRNHVIGEDFNYYTSFNFDKGNEKFMEEFQIEFWLHVLVGEGLIKREDV